MSTPYVGEIRLVGFNFAPVGWELCQGQLLDIAQNDTLFNLIGTTYGGDGQTTFALPDLQGRAPIHQGAGHTIGQRGGAENVTVTTLQIPAHTHPVSAQGGAGNSTTPTGAFFAGSTEDQYASSGPAVSGQMLTATGQNQPHDNLMPYLCINYIISLFGIFPSQS